MKMEKNRIYQIDALEGLRQIEDNSIDIIITSPPYNKLGFGKKKKDRNSRWNKEILYGGIEDVDNMDEEEYEQWQIQILNECFRVLKDDGSMFYNHKVRTKKNQISHPIEWINKTKLFCRQIITWDRTNSPNIDPCRYIPTTELIFWLTKTNKNPDFKRNKDSIFQTEVWRLPAKNQKDHPAPFPIEIPYNILQSIPNPNKDKIVLDPFMGSGTTAVAAIRNHFDYIGFDIIEEYIISANNRIKNERKTN